MLIISSTIIIINIYTDIIYAYLILHVYNFSKKWIIIIFQNIII